MSLSDDQVRETVAAVDALLERVENITDPSARETVLATVQALLDLYGEGLERMIGHVATHCRGAVQEDIASAFAGDELVSHLLLLHGLHPAGHLSVTTPEPQPVFVPLRRARHDSAPLDSVRDGAEVPA